MNKTAEKKMLAAANRIIKSAKKVQAGRPSLWGVFVQNDKEGNKRYCVCDGYRAVRFYEEPALEMVAVKGVMDLNNIVQRIDNDVLIDTPDIADLKEYIKEHKDAAYQLDANFGVWVNTKYLVDMLECLPNAKIYVASKHSAIYFDADNGDGVLMPIRHD